MTMHPLVLQATGIPGLDTITNGGIPTARTTLVAGTSGSGKTVLALQFLVNGIRLGEPAVFVTFEETPDDIRLNCAGFGWDLDAFEKEGMLAFVDASPDPAAEVDLNGDFDLGALVSRIEHAVSKVGAKRVSLDSLGALFGQFDRPSSVRTELRRIAHALRKLGVTSMLTAERTQEYGEIARFGIEEFVADNVIVLRNVLEEERRRRTIEILKFRGGPHASGQYPFTMLSEEGIVILPLSGMDLDQNSSNERVTSGIAELDEMCGGGMFRDSVTLISGATGTGKTLTCAHFLNGGALRGERVLLFAFEESREQLFRNAKTWGIDFEAQEKAGLLRVECAYPESLNLEDHLLRMRRIIEDFQPNRVAIDSLSALERTASIKSFREFIIGLTSFIKHQDIAGLITSTTPTLLGGYSITEAHISTLTDAIVLLRYVEIFGEMRRGLTVLKMRGSMHDKHIREFTIDGSGMHIGRSFTTVTGIVSGKTFHLQTPEVERVAALFSPGGLEE